METVEQVAFWIGYSIGLEGKRFPISQNEWIWRGFCEANCWASGNFQATKWQAWCRRFREFFRINFILLRKRKFSKMSLHPDMIDVRSTRNTSPKVLNGH